MACCRLCPSIFLPAFFTVGRRCGSSPSGPRRGLSFLKRSDFEEFAKKYPEVYKILLTLVAARLRETDATIAAGTFLPLRGRIARTLLEVAQDFGKTLVPAVSRSDGRHRA